MLKFGAMIGQNTFQTAVAIQFRILLLNNNNKKKKADKNM